MTRHIGIDLHRNCFTAAVLSGNGRTYVTDYRMEQLPKFIDRLRSDDEIAVEVTGNTRLFYKKVKPYVGRMAIVNPRQFKVVSQSVKKTDTNDSKTLAKFLAKDMLPEVRMKDDANAQLHSLVQTRDKLVKLRTTLKNKINNILSAHGINMSKEALSSDRGLREVLGMPLGPVVDLELKVLVDQIRSLNHSVAELEEVIRKEGQKLPGLVLRADQKQTWGWQSDYCPSP